MDVRNMDFEPKSFDCVIDKGLLDSILVNILFFEKFIVFKTNIKELNDLFMNNMLI